MPSAVIGFGSAIVTMPGRKTLSASRASVRSAKTCGVAVTMSMPWIWVGRDCTPFWRKNCAAMRTLSIGLPGLISATIFL